MFNAESRRPMAKGILNPREPAATHVLEIDPRHARAAGANPAKCSRFPCRRLRRRPARTLTYHEETLKRYLRGRGYTPLAVNEGLAVVLAELANESFTGIGISCGGGMCNVAISYLSIPSLAFSIAQGGDFIDSAVGSVVHESATRVKAIKEDDLDLTRSTDDKIARRCTSTTTS